jgi:hemerythrin-like metal-binding protein
MAEQERKKEYNIGVEALDEEHQDLFNGLREIESAIAENAAQETTRAILRKIAESTRVHFGEEEAQMQAGQYPGLALHAANHQRLMEKLLAFAARYWAGGQKIDRHALNFLRDWLLYHIQNDDTRYGSWMKDRERAQARADQKKQASGQAA